MVYSLYYAVQKYCTAQFSWVFIWMSHMYRLYSLYFYTVQTFIGIQLNLFVHPQQSHDYFKTLTKPLTYLIQKRNEMKLMKLIILVFSISGWGQLKTPCTRPLYNISLTQCNTMLYKAQCKEYNNCCLVWNKLCASGCKVFNTKIENRINCSAH